MTEDIRMWEVLEDDSLKQVDQSKLDFEDRLENWLESDISIISDDLLVIGRQVETDFGGVIDLLCMDYRGDLVIVELKRDKTPREITAQILDYASWVSELSNDDTTQIWGEYIEEDVPLEEIFKDKFKDDLPEILNEHHRMLIIGSEIDSSSERIIKYLSDTYGVNINAITFQYFKKTDGEFIARTFLIEPSQAEYLSQVRGKSKRKPRLSYDQLQEIADQANDGEMYKILVNKMPSFFDGRSTTRSSIVFIGYFGDSRNNIFSLLPPESDNENGLRFQVYINRFAEYFKISTEKAISILPEHKEEWEYSLGASDEYKGFAGFFSKIEEVHDFIRNLQAI